MRVLVEQTEQEIRRALGKGGLDVLWDEQGDHAGHVGVHVLKGGVGGGEWHLHPEQPAVLIGTQDMLQSRAMNRGYGSPRARWPMEFGLLNQDCLWVMDEVQLMDVGLATSAQLQAFREQDAAKQVRPCFSWWMSATLQREWLSKSPDTDDLVAEMPEPVRIQPAQRTGMLWDGVRKQCRVELMESEKDIAKLIARAHREGGSGAKGPTLAVLNRVDRATRVYRELISAELRSELGDDADIRLIHSRYRPEERKEWCAAFLSKAACAPGTNRVIVATQVIEAGVDISAGVLITELAPWPSLVQRFGRCARWGGEAQVIVVDLACKDEHAAAPYDLAAIDAARDALCSPLLSDVSPSSLEAFEEAHVEVLPRLYPYEPKQLLLRQEIDELFDTTPDLTGADIDISRFIRSGEERDLQVFWLTIPSGALQDRPPAATRPSRDALCAVPFLKARDWLCGRESATNRQARLRNGMRAWAWDWLEGRWAVVKREDLYPGRIVLVSSDSGGYGAQIGWDPQITCLDPALRLDFDVVPDKDEIADDSQDDETLSFTEHGWQTIGVHGRETGRMAAAIAKPLAPPLERLFEMAGRWHDAGKVHPAFNNSIVSGPQRGLIRPENHDLAKAPRGAWRFRHHLYPMEPDGSNRRPGFRHELASTLALFGVLQRHAPDHASLLGPWRALFDSMGVQLSPPLPSQDPSALEREILDLDADSFDLLAYLVCSHHGKLRMTWHASPADQSAATEKLRIRGVEETDTLPSVKLATADGRFQMLPATPMDLSPAAAGINPRTGRAWTDRVLGLLDRHGPFALAWMEAVMRAADQRASRLTDIVDPLLVLDRRAQEPADERAEVSA
jgi:CRISPR-associated endonuclease/helicase Cas3